MKWVQNILCSIEHHSWKYYRKIYTIEDPHYPSRDIDLTKDHRDCTNCGVKEYYEPSLGLMRWLSGGRGGNESNWVRIRPGKKRPAKPRSGVTIVKCKAVRIEE